MLTMDMKNQAVDMHKLSTNFINVVADCDVDGLVPKNVINDNFPLVTWLLNTSFARVMRERSTNPMHFRKSDTEGVEWEMTVPGTIWTLEPANSTDDCCWAMPDFAKCASDVPLFLLCLKDCDSIFDNLVYKNLKINEKTAINGIAYSGETAEETNDRIRRLWMAFYTAKTAILGTSTTSDNIVKPFHGLLEVMENDAVTKIYGGNILAAFDSLGCRLDVLGGSGYVFAVNPIIYSAIDAAVVAGQNGELPSGWSRVNGELKYKGIGFIADKLVPVDQTAGTGEVWVLASDAVGLFLATTLMPTGSFIVKDDFTEQTKAEGCAERCTYLYNYGAVANNNATRLAVITDIPVASACTDAIGDLGDLINPETLIVA